LLTGEATADALLARHDLTELPEPVVGVLGGGERRHEYAQPGCGQDPPHEGTPMRQLAAQPKAERRQGGGDGVRHGTPLA